MATRRTRIVCISDTHNQTPKLPPGDILIHAGDLTNQGTYSELQKTVDWIKQSNFKIKIIVCGNHDITCDEDFYRQYGGYFHNKRREDPQRCIDLFQSDSSIVYLNHEAKQISLDFEDGQRVKFKIFGSPYSPAHGFWAFGYSPDTASQLWDQIPLDSDVVIAHTPAKFHRDECGKRGSAGCEILRQTLWRVRPRLFVCGHIHEAFGVEVVSWDLSSTHIQFKEQSVREHFDPDPTSKKQFLVDLSFRAKSVTLQNDGTVTDMLLSIHSSHPRGPDVDGSVDDAGGDPTYERYSDNGAASLPKIPSIPDPPFPDFDKAHRPEPSTKTAPTTNHTATLDQGASPLSPYSDRKALSGREGRLETCIVNAAFMGSNWPHQGGKKFHKPVVIDLELPLMI